MLFRHLVLTTLLLAGIWPGRRPGPGLEVRRGLPAGCSGTRAPVLFGLLARPLTLAEMVDRLEQGCLMLDEVRFQPGDSAILFSPAGLAQVARALGLARGAYRIAVPAEAVAGWPPDTVQARRRGTKLREELVHQGASLERLLDEPGLLIVPLAAGRGGARPMIVRVLNY